MPISDSGYCSCIRSLSALVRMSVTSRDLAATKIRFYTVCLLLILPEPEMKEKQKAWHVNMVQSGK